jgi:SH3 domain protein
MLSYQRIFIVVLVAFFCTTGLTWAETRYISDQLVVSLREQPQNNAKSIVYLRTDTQVEVLDVGEEYAQVKTENGEVGYIQKHYLTKDTPKARIISRLTRENQGLQERIRELEQRYNESFAESDVARKKTLSELDEARSRVEALEKELQITKAELAESAKAYATLKKNAENVVDITAERDRLRLSQEELTATVARLKEENEEYLTKETTQWFLAGAGVLFFGWLLGRFSRAKRKSTLYR